MAGQTVFSRNLSDQDLIVEGALPNGAATSYSPAIKLGPGVHPDGIELLVSIPAATTSEAPDTRTLTVDIVAGDTATPTTAASVAQVLTGAGGVGFGAAEFRFKIAPQAGDYIRARFVGGTSFGNMSGKNGTLKVLQ